MTIIRALSGFLAAALLLQGCASQVLNEHFLKGDIEKSVPSGDIVELARTRSVELLSPCSVRVGERIVRSEKTTLYYRTLAVRQKATPLRYPFLDAYLKVLLSTTLIPLFTPSYWVEGSYAGPDCKKQPALCEIRDETSVVNEYTTELDSRKLPDRMEIAPERSTVSIFMNGYYQGEAPVGQGGVATVAIPGPPVVSAYKDLKITFKYGDGYAYSLVSQPDIENVRKACRTGSRPERPQDDTIP